MELKEFITQTLVQVVEGIEEAQKKPQEKGWNSAKIIPKVTKQDLKDQGMSPYL